MDEFWKGTLYPTFTKHRDYAHNSWAAHELDNGGRYEVQEPVYCDQDPITEELLDPSDKYWTVEFTLHNKDVYTYLIPAEADGSKPNKQTVIDAITRYAKNPLPSGEPRNFYDYIDFEKTIEEYPDGLFGDVKPTSVRVSGFNLKDILSE